jgi:hypothetical protein
MEKSSRYARSRPRRTTAIRPSCSIGYVGGPHGVDLDAQLFYAHAEFISAEKRAGAIMRLFLKEQFASCWTS